MALDVTLEKALPHSLKAERSVLGAILLDNAAMHVAQQNLRHDDFYRDGHQKIYQAIEELASRGAAVDLITLTEELERRGHLESAGGPAAVAALVDGVPRSANIDHYIRIVREKSTLRRLIGATGQILEKAYAAGDDCDRILDDAEREIFKIAESRLRAGFVPINAVAESTLRVLEDLSARKELITGIATGFQRLDELTSGLQAGELIVVAARPSMGKTAFCLNIAQHAALHGKTKIGIFSLEMSREQLFQRMLCAAAHLDSHLLRTGRLRKEEWTKLQMTFETLAQVPIWIDDTPGLGIMEMRGKAMRLKAEHGLDLLIVDYMQLMVGRGRYESRQQEISDISRSLKELAKELRVPVIACSQLSRAPEQRGGDHRPQLSDLRESGAIEQDADTVLFIFRPEMYGETDENRGKAEVLIRKPRTGPTGEIDMVFVKNFTLFANPEYERG